MLGRFPTSSVTRHDHWQEFACWLFALHESGLQSHLKFKAVFCEFSKVCSHAYVRASRCCSAVDRSHTAADGALRCHTSARAFIRIYFCYCQLLKLASLLCPLHSDCGH